MKIIVELTFKDGVATMSVDSEERRECHMSMGSKEVEYTNENYEWASVLMGSYVHGLLSSANPKKPANTGLQRTAGKRRAKSKGNQPAAAKA